MNAILDYVDKKLSKEQREDLRLLISAQNSVKEEYHQNPGVLLSSLDIAVLGQNTDLIKQLHRLGADLDKKNPQGGCAAFDAVNNGYVEVLKTLKALGANLNITTGNGATLAHFAAYQGDITVLEELRV